MDSCFRDCSLELSLKDDFVRHLHSSADLEPQQDSMEKWCFIEDGCRSGRKSTRAFQAPLNPARTLESHCLQKQFKPVCSQKMLNANKQSAVHGNPLNRSPFSLKKYLNCLAPVSDKKLRPKVTSPPQTSECQQRKGASPQKMPADANALHSDSSDRRALQTGASAMSITLDKTASSRQDSKRLNIIEVEDGGSTYQFLACSVVNSPCLPVSLSDIGGLNPVHPANTLNAATVANRHSCRAREETSSDRVLDTFTNNNAQSQRQLPQSRQSGQNTESASLRQATSNPPQRSSQQRVRKITIIPNTRLSPRPDTLASQQHAAQKLRSTFARSADSHGSVLDLKLSSALLSSIVHKYLRSRSRQHRET